MRARTAEQLMRSRYSAYARGDRDYLLRTWNPRTRPTPGDIDVAITWTGLTVTDTIAGGPKDDEGTVTFRATFVQEGEVGQMVERSRFVRRAGRWTYLDGVISPPFGRLTAGS